MRQIEVSHVKTTLSHAVLPGAADKLFQYETDEAFLGPELRGVGFPVPQTA
jgi:hypothetical protein